MPGPELVGIHHVKFPVTDLARSRAWYERVFGLRPVREFAYEVPGLPELNIALRENPAAARGISGFDPVSFAIADRGAAQAWADRLDELGVAHSPVIDATIGWLLVFHDPDGTEIHLYSMERHGIDPTGRSHTGRPVDATSNRAPER